MSIEEERSPDNNVTEFIVSADLDFSTFPGEAGPPGCTVEQVRWLQEHATEALRSHAVAVRSTSESGAWLAVANWQAYDVQRSDVTDPVFRLECPNGGDGGVIAADLWLDTDNPAIESDSGYDTPLVANAAPGEMVTVALNLHSSTDVTFRLRADVHAGDEEQTHTVSLAALPEKDGTYTLRSAGRAESLNVSVGVAGEMIPHESNEPVFECRENDRVEACTTWGVRSRLARLWERPSIVSQVVDEMSDGADCSSPAIDSARIAELISGFYGPDPADLELPLATDVVARLHEKCGERYAGSVAAGISTPAGLPEASYSALGDAATQPRSDAEIDLAQRELDDALRQLTCEDPAVDAALLSDTWTKAWGTSWSSQSGFMAQGPTAVRTVVAQCGGEYAEQVVQTLNVVGTTWRVLSGALDPPS